MAFNFFFKSRKDRSICQNRLLTVKSGPFYVYWIYKKILFNAVLVSRLKAY